MRTAVLLSAATLAKAMIIPNGDLIKDIKLEDRKGHPFFVDYPEYAAPSLKEKVEIISNEIASGAHSIMDTVKAEFEHIFNQESVSEKEDFYPDVEVQDHDFSNYTIYELISGSKHTTNFSKLVDKHDKIVKLLNDTDGEYTLFVPVDGAFAHIPKDHDKPSDEFVERLLQYHVGLDSYPAKRILATHTLPTALKESLLGDHPQRLRTSVGLSGVRVNVYSKVIAANIKAKNGYIHAVNKILVPPPSLGRELNLFPSQFSTLLLAYEKTDFVKFIHNVKLVGSTVFAPSNSAWARLGFRANAFLFNTETGHKYLKALLKYQIVANTTVYTDEIYYGDDDEKKNEMAEFRANGGNIHLELHTLLHHKAIGVDIHKFLGFKTIVVNGFAKVGFADAVGKNGVIHVIERVPLPPHRKHHGKDEQVDGEISVEDLKERLAEYVSEEEVELFGEL